MKRDLITSTLQILWWVRFHLPLKRDSLEDSWRKGCFHLGPGTPHRCRPCSLSDIQSPSSIHQKMDGATTCRLQSQVLTEKWGAWGAVGGVWMNHVSKILNPPRTAAGCEIYNQLQNESNIQHHPSTFTHSGRNRGPWGCFSSSPSWNGADSLHSQVQWRALTAHYVVKNPSAPACTGHREADRIPAA